MESRNWESQQTHWFWKETTLLIEAGVTQFNISLDTLVSAKFNFITRRRGFSRVLSAIQATEEAYQDASVVKVNCVVMRGMNEDEIVDFVTRKIEKSPFDSLSTCRSIVTNGKQKNSCRLRKCCLKYETYTVIWNVSVILLEVTQKTYRIQFLGTSGFVTSMTNHFCRGCNRLRLTADGNLKVRFKREHARENLSTRPLSSFLFKFIFVSILNLFTYRHVLERRKSV